MNSSARGQSPKPEAGFRWPTSPRSTSRLPQARGELGDAVEAGQRVVAAGGDDAGKRQPRRAAPAASRWRAAPRPSDSPRASAARSRAASASSAPQHGAPGLLRPVRDHDAAAAVRDDHQRARRRPAPRARSRATRARAVEVLAAHRRHRAHAAAARSRQQRLPVRVDMVAQAGDDEDGRRMRAPVTVRPTLRRKPCWPPLAVGREAVRGQRLLDAVVEHADLADARALPCRWRSRGRTRARCAPAARSAATVLILLAARPGSRGCPRCRSARAGPWRCPSC